MRREHRLLVALGILGAGAFVGCNAILGYEEATVNPTFTAGDSSTGTEAGNDTGSTEAGNDGGTVDAGKDVVVPFDAMEVNCTNYCALMAAGCQGENLQYLTATVCQEFCTKGIDIGGPTDTAENTLVCRQLYAEKAAQNIDPANNCPNAGPLGGGVCNPDPCVSYCKISGELCPAIFDGGAACSTACKRWPYQRSAPVSAREVNTLNCRAYHIQAAYQAAPGTLGHCNHTSPSNAASFCNLDAGSD